MITNIVKFNEHLTSATLLVWDCGHKVEPQVPR